MHGGAFQFGDLDTKEADWTARQLVQRASATIVSVDYRLAGIGVKYPIPLDDVIAAIRWVQANMTELGVTSLRWVEPVQVPIWPLPLLCDSGTRTCGCRTSLCWCIP